MLSILRLVKFTCAILVLAVFAACDDATKEQQRAPNILFILVDDLGYADLGCYGSKEVKSPHIDQLAKDGIKCTSAYVTAPQCAPSRAGLISGFYQQRHGFEVNPEPYFRDKFGLDTSLQTMADHLKLAGYFTYGFGKWDLGAIPSAQPWNRGFDEFYGFYTGSRSYFTNPKEDNYQALRNGPNTKSSDKGYITDLITNQAIASVKKKHEKPWFMYVSYSCPHWPMQAKAKDLQKFNHIKDIQRRTYLAMMSNLDENIGKLTNALKETKQDEQTLIVFLSDNGGPTGSRRPSNHAPFEMGTNTSSNLPFKGVKGDVFEGGIRVPCLFSWPGVLDKNIEYDYPISSLDLVPTFLNLSNPAKLPRFDGVDVFASLQSGEKLNRKAPLFWRWKGKWAIRYKDWKLVIPKRGDEQLYQLNVDPTETNDLAKVHPAKLRELKAQLVKWDSTLHRPKYMKFEKVKKLAAPLGAY